MMLTAGCQDCFKLERQVLNYFKCYSHIVTLVYISGKHRKESNKNQEENEEKINNTINYIVFYLFCTNNVFKVHTIC